VGKLVRLVALIVVAAVAYRALQMAGVIGGEDEIAFEWAEDD
jgi:hypothetical protein